MPTLKVDLTVHQEEWIGNLVASGRYCDAGEVMRAGIRLLEHQAAEDEARLQALREAADVGFADIEEGRFQTFDAPESLRRHLPQLAEDAITDPATKAKGRSGRHRGLPLKKSYLLFQNRTLTAVIPAKAGIQGICIFVFCFFPPIPC